MRANHILPCVSHYIARALRIAIVPTFSALPKLCLDQHVQFGVLSTGKTLTNWSKPSHYGGKGKGRGGLFYNTGMRKGPQIATLTR